MVSGWRGRQGLGCTGPCGQNWYSAGSHGCGGLMIDRRSVHSDQRAGMFLLLTVVNITPAWRPG